MAYGTKCDFSRGEGFSYGDVVHLLQGTRKPKVQGRSSDDDPYFLDENIRGYGWGDNQDLKEINKMELGIGPLSQELRDLRKEIYRKGGVRILYPASGAMNPFKKMRGGETYES